MDLRLLGCLVALAQMMAVILFLAPRLPEGRSRDRALIASALLALSLGLIGYALDAVDPQLR